MFSTDPWTWIAAILTLAIFSFLYRDNPLYRLAEHVFVGLSAGYGIVIIWYNSMVPNFVDPLLRFVGGWSHLSRVWLDGLVLIPGMLGIMFLTMFTKKYSYLILIPLAVIMGMDNGVAVPAVLQAEVLKQAQGTLQGIHGPLLAGQPLPLVNGIIILIGVLGTLGYFFFSKEHKGALGTTAKVGIWFIMLGFGASFGYTVMARLSLLIGRIQFLLTDWIHVIR
jgi:hypothetical protein